MAGFDDPGIFFSNFDDADGERNGVGGDAANLRQASKRGFRDFLREFHEGNFVYVYRDQLRHHYNLRQFFVEISLEDLTSFNEVIADKLIGQPTEYLPLFEEAARELADEVTRPRPEGEEDVRDIQVIVTSSRIASALRDIKSEQVSKLVKICGIVLSASGARSKATRITLQCRGCQNVVANVPIKPGLEGYTLPRKCASDAAGRATCPLDPYFIVPDKCVCVDFQLLKLQEVPDEVPNGEMPRHFQLYLDRYLCERVVPGNRVTVVGIFSVKKIGKAPKRSSRDKVAVGIRSSYLRVVGIKVDTELSGRTSSTTITAEEEEEFRRFAASPDVYERVARSIAPSIYGSADIKKAIACLLFGGSRKRLPDGLTRRGDINVLLLGDPGTAKSQLLKFAERVSPIGVYTSGKGSSAAGLTASVIRDPASRTFVMEGGAMVLADGGVVCIDEFDKMREDDRVAIHEAMEQQTISIAKAGITTTLNSRCSVLAAANSVFGRWDESKGDQNIDFMPTILSRFDTIFIVKDEHSAQRDITMAKHVISIHANAFHESKEAEGELSLNFLKKYIAFCKARCGPRLSFESGEKLKNQYILMRSGTKQHELDTATRPSLPITVRQLEAVVRLSEALAKMQLKPFVTDSHVDEALRLFQVSTLEAAHSGGLAGAEGFTTPEDQDTTNRIEKQLKRRFPIGTQVSEYAIVQDFLKQRYPEHAVHKVLQLMVRRGELLHRFQRKTLIRVK